MILTISIDTWHLIIICMPASYNVSQWRYNVLKLREHLFLKPPATAAVSEQYHNFWLVESKDLHIELQMVSMTLNIVKRLMSLYCCLGRVHSRLTSIFAYEYLINEGIVVDRRYKCLGENPLVLRYDQVYRNNYVLSKRKCIHYVTYILGWHEFDT